MTVVQRRTLNGENIFKLPTATSCDQFVLIFLPIDWVSMIWEPLSCAVIQQNNWLHGLWSASFIVEFKCNQLNTCRPVDNTHL